jgi:hypothetical protein
VQDQFLESTPCSRRPPSSVLSQLGEVSSAQRDGPSRLTATSLEDDGIRFSRDRSTIGAATNTWYVHLALIGLTGGLITGISLCILPVLPVIFFSGVRSTAEDVAVPRRTGGAVVTAVNTKHALSRTLRPLLSDRRPGTQLQPGDVDGLGITIAAAPTAGRDSLVALVAPGGGGSSAALPHGRAIAKTPVLPHSAETDHDPQRWVRARAGRALYVPCAGPVLAVIVVAGATASIGPKTVVLTCAFAAGATLPLLMFALTGQRVAERQDPRLFRVDDHTQSGSDS